MKLKLKAAVFHCGRCRKSYSNPLGHVCVTRLDKPARSGKTKVKPEVSVTGKCGTCHKPMGNPVTHVCMVPTDFKRRAAKAKAAQKQPHRYQSCRDRECERIPCLAYREGTRDGYQDGHGDGYQEGYDVGFPDGINACPRKHGE